ncbi:hypothetical protein Cs7R123_08340 [Catellatospora sp. TT07R-123]|uniref:hypothetical protein n=1 Tax=Catellatospora sp. TT07R-123 TaxID=2733863 RepID=UPI001B247461|nr:hypothetical protein [Catellatospora sp. TT07R-123]GHJ43492.1 hypothetical protein Cs7R123_08340 [Catellatospora sp. TT07R-123]
MNSEDRPRRRPGLRLAVGAALTALAVISVTGVAVADSGTSRAAVSARTDAYTRDQIGDTGIEPNPSGLPFWASPDIRVCTTALGCASDQPLTVGGTAYVFVDINVPGPYGTGVSNGTLNVYYTVLGGAAQWPADWTPIGAVAVPASPGVTTVTIPWLSVPDDGPAPGAHFCLLTRWVSPTDPMTFEGPNTVANTTANNNISWHNLAPIPVPANSSTGTTVPFAIGNVANVPTANDLVFGEAADRHFETVGGKVVVDLGGQLFQRWQQAGARGTGIRAIGGTKIQILDLTKARIAGLTINPGERPQVLLTFTAALPASAPFPITVTQFGPGQAGAQPTDIGGVRYDVTVVRG